MPKASTEAVATRFVDLVTKNMDWVQVKELPADEVQILFDIVSAAGFDVKDVVPGKLHGNYRDQDGSVTGETYPINCLCPYKVRDQKDQDFFFATGWLESVLRHVLSALTRKDYPRENVIETVDNEIKRSIPLTPIQLTKEGDLLGEYPPSPSMFGFDYFVDHSRDENNMETCAGVHVYCDGWMDRHRASVTHDAISCRKYHLRVPFPKEAKTYGDLRTALAHLREATST